ncbi:MAG: hypothetical protein A2X19_01525 [Bacteroidetes bacterium GWE2_39_28]|nr:MAG: hypothetical protein A2X19_01525 [Bacteroidetes bacterium GWE2_39_28]OFY15806.1 MAG: hypothetical protein A2X16_01795 [Bacteroidetes bacterium GWF2_39_10]OFZ06891.1 MAG: hypothetical protein A2322_01590 [Bacteroidetes bacterium RIFOXYB2_FULL_39_7]OFZ09974.1 MAG: hypothetical protein A2465_06735 [Bacteroidetes bacterium RIFOXYC2_FULL_39_11]HCT93517.1 anti-sigma factor antagonist [Rikenellaceae bacterium]
MNILSDRNGSEINIIIEGRIDTTNFNEFEALIEDLLKDKTSKITLDCSKLNYISSSGLRIFLIMQKKMMSTKGVLILKNMQPSIKEVFDISGFSTIFNIE